MPVPPIELEVASQIGKLYARAEAEINERLWRIMDQPNQASMASRLRALLDVVHGHQQNLEVEARKFIEQQIPRLYQSGALQHAAAVGAPFAWTQANTQAVGLIATSAYSNVLRATEYMDRDIKALIRSEAQATLSNKAALGETALNAGDELRDRLLAQGISAITYADGANVPASVYADMLMRTESANAYNLGNLQTMTAADVAYVEIEDSPDCGLDGHDDPQLADGMLLAVDVADQYLISHPNCVRDFSPSDVQVGDVDGADMIDADGNPTSPDLRTTAEADADQANVVEYMRANDLTARDFNSTRYDQLVAQGRIGPGGEIRPPTREPREPREPRTPPPEFVQGIENPEVRAAVEADYNAANDAMASLVDRLTEAGVTAPSIDLAGIPPQVQSAIVGWVNDSIDKYPQLIGVYNGLAEITSTMPPGFDNAYAAALQATRGKLYFNPTYFNSLDNLQAKLDADLLTKWHPTNDPASVVEHEVGHLLDSIARQDADYIDGLANLLATVSDPAGNYASPPVVFDKYVADIKAYLEETGARPSQLERQTASQISRYGNWNAKELIAEAFAQVQTEGDNASPLAKAIVKWVDDMSTSVADQIKAAR